MYGPERTVGPDRLWQPLILRPVPALCLVLFCLGTTHPVPAAQDSIILEVRAGAQDRNGTTVTAALPASLASAKHLWMQRLDSGTTVPVQRTTSDIPQVTWLLQDRLPRHQARRYRLSATQFERNREENVVCTEDGRELSVTVRGLPVLSYHTAVVDPPAGIDSVFRRSGFIHPLRTPRGEILTAAFPADHPHQHGVFHAWVKAEIDGRTIDFWNQAGGTGTVEHADVLRVVNGPVFAEFLVKLQHVDLAAKPKAVPALDELWTVRVYNRSDLFVFDLESEQSCSSAAPVVLEEYHYGGMAFRGTSDWIGADTGQFLTSERRTRTDGNHSRPYWTDLSGHSNGRPCGVAVLQHPSNPRFPAPVRLHPEKPYFVYTPVFLGQLRIEPEQPYVARYRYVIHDGRPDPAVLDAAWSDYADPPEVRIIE